MFKKVKDCIFLLGVVIIFIAFGMFLYKNPLVEGHGGGGRHGGGGHGGGGQIASDRALVAVCA